MTEIVVLSHITPLGLLDDKHLGSCGKLLPGFEAKEGNNINEPNKTGELYIKSPTVMLGYFNMSSEDENVIDEKGWLRTGDLMYYDDDRFYYVVGRVKDLIKVNGIQVSPSELEDVILTHPSVKEVAVIGIDHPESGQVPKALVVLEDGADQQSISLKIKALVIQKLSHTKQLRGGVQICAELPRTSTGKIKRSELRKIVTS
ncbi:unnamed protein product [Cylicostephanus goldi]|uniref:AMP-binding enzyme C-terminal domain-containing protein n=1 Tax=Cylicostephanus goldi TaxID=71465 RepID=A0A3P7MTE9_CYLGO|nr:unnamed protein product [Cylicostephanus goldi]